jgi:hypothetical protein
MENQDLLNLLDERAKCLVGIICKRVEILEKEGVLTSSLFKLLTKETIYEEFRTIKALIKIGKLVFTNRPKIG